MKVVYIETGKKYTVKLKSFEAYELLSEYCDTKDYCPGIVYLPTIVPKYRILYNGVPISLDKDRFITKKEYRKLKLKKIQNGF